MDNKSHDSAVRSETWGKERDKQSSSDSQEDKNQLILMAFSVFYASLVISSTKGGDGERQMRKEHAKERTEEKETGGSSGTGLALRENSRIVLQHVWPSRARKWHGLQCHTSLNPRIPFCTPQLYITLMCSVMFISWQAHWVCVTGLDSFDLSSTLNVRCKTCWSLFQNKRSSK